MCGNKTERYNKWGVFFFLGGNSSTISLWPKKDIFAGNVDIGAVVKYNNISSDIIFIFFFYYVILRNRKFHNILIAC